MRPYQPSWHGRVGAGLSDRSVAEIVKARAAARAGAALSTPAARLAD